MVTTRGVNKPLAVLGGESNLQELGFCHGERPSHDVLRKITDPDACRLSHIVRRLG